MRPTTLFTQDILLETNVISDVHQHVRHTDATREGIIYPNGVQNGLEHGTENGPDMPRDKPTEIQKGTTDYMSGKME